MREILDYLLGVYPLVLVLVFVAWIAAPRRSKRLTRWSLLVTWLGLVVIGAPPVATGLNSLLADAAPPPNRETPPDLIIVPTAGIVSLSDGTSFPSITTVQRLLAGLAAQKQWSAPVLLTGGSPIGGPPESEVAVDSLDLVVDDALMIEAESQNTCENARAAAAIAVELATTQVLLVTSSQHMMRAAACLRHYGLNVHALSADTVYEPTGLWAYLPSHRSMNVTMGSIRELIGVGFYVASGVLSFDDL